ncbi:MAG TPA: AAA family ATPase [Bdellovibrionota bacterium]|nr:AAA family ATPase [Bdellovibrionota bacterium]
MKQVRTIPRLVTLPDRSFFLFGPRGIGKSTWLSQVLSQAKRFDLLKTDLQLRFNAHPEELEALIGSNPPEWIWIDEVQKVPRLLDEVHRLMETHRLKFALSGSSARKLKREGANLLAGRAITKNMEQFSYGELGHHYNLSQAIQYGLLPLIYLYPKDAPETLQTYVHTYIKEEIKEEGVVRKLDPFLRFLEIAGRFNGQQVNASNIARDAMISRSNIDNYFGILSDTHLGYFLSPYRPNLKVREVTHPKFYWFDPGVARAASNLVYEPMDEIWAGTALETILFHEFRVYNEYSKKHRGLFFYRTTLGSEIDFIIELAKQKTSKPAEIICLEIKYSKKWKREWFKPILSLQERKGINIIKAYGIYMGTETLTYHGFEVLPILTFLEKLFDGHIF